ncbi:glutathionylspermidine synthase [Paenibacillus sp. CCS19]|uniref:glutathionylspermidine synthase family protein n=1 Tax=Paenibacillus sp. CCS19 TaxID=3158387 RepID=UPI00256DA33F|nr:glutathionylspermidine synthase family protein [Paenibacillus cellulosilyticus]GMK37647.1 glutathionylspermidine synthase [Paenibacillus cellulosilyticus]
MTNDFHRQRSRFYDSIPDYWADLYGQEYSLYDVRELSLAEVLRIREATHRIGHLFARTASLLRTVDDDTLLSLGFPAAALSYIRLHKLSVESVIARLDLVKCGDTYKCIEINADTPTFIKEVHQINGIVCDHFDLHNPNEGFEKQLALAVERAIVESLDGLALGHTPNVVFTAHADHIEDYYTTQYLMSLTQLPSRFVALDQLQIIQDDGLYDDRGTRIDVLYRQTFPVEIMLEDADEEGNPIGQWLLELVEQNKLAVINPPSSFLLQSKAVQAVIWGLHEEQSPYFTAEEHAWIKEHCLPTYLEADTFLERQCWHVKKPAFGREGDTVQIRDGSGKVVTEDRSITYANHLSVYQQYVELPQAQYRTENGVQHGSCLIGSFLIGGRAGAIGMRIGDMITNNGSYYLPIGIRK